MDAIVLVVGDEILQGHTRDHNLWWLAGRLDELGHRLLRAEVLPDELPVVEAHLGEALDEADVVLVTGGLGPTHDDRTTEAVAAVLEVELETHPEALEDLEERYRRLRQRDPDDDVRSSALKMVTVPSGARVLPNPVGSALGYAAQARGAWVVVMPGVPREMEAIFDEHVAEAILPNLGRGDRVVEVLVHLPEAEFAPRLRSLQDRHAAVAVGSYPRVDAPKVLLRLRGPPDAVEDALADLQGTLGEHLDEPKDL